MTLSEIGNERDESEINHGCSIVPLIPYLHQVGGHHCVLQYDEQTICKPLDEREFKCYTELPPDLKAFAPEYRGVVRVHFEVCDRDLKCFALPEDCSLAKDMKRLRNYLSSTKALKWHAASNNASSCSSSGSSSEEEFPGTTRCECGKGSDYTSPWTSQIQMKLFEKWKKSKNKRGLEKFILLENISKKFNFPCALDLKMGTRGHGDWVVNQEKLDRHRLRAQQSTSGSLGVRLCGMQVYEPCNDSFHYTDKYQGRHADTIAFKNYMRQYLWNGQRHRTDLIPPLLRKLHALLTCIKRRDGFRFYCSSLLIVYDGLDYSPHEIEVRMIDFAQTRLKQEESNQHVGPDHGYILGLKSLIRVFAEILEELTTENRRFARRSLHDLFLDFRSGDKSEYESHNESTKSRRRSSHDHSYDSKYTEKGNNSPISPRKHSEKRGDRYHLEKGNGDKADKSSIDRRFGESSCHMVDSCKESRYY